MTRSVIAVIVCFDTSAPYTCPGVRLRVAGWFGRGGGLPVMGAVARVSRRGRGCPAASSRRAGVAGGWLLAQEPLPGCDELAGLGWSP